MKSMQLTALSAAMALALPVLAQSSKTETPSITPVDETVAKQQKEKTKPTEKDKIEVITVTGVYQADVKARGIERDRETFSSVIATDDLGNFVDQNVAESLRRMPGVTLERSEGEGKYVAVRGLGPTFVSVQMNGAELSGAGDDRKVGLDGITGDSLGVIEVFKTLTPDMNLNSIGGLVNVKAISAYDRGKNTLKVKLQNSYSDLREENSPKFSLDGTQLFLDEKLGIGFAASYEDRKTQVKENRHHSTRELNFLSGGIGLTEDELEVAPEILIPAQLENRLEIADRKRTTATLNIEYKPDEDNFYYIRGNYSNYTDKDVALREFFNFYKGDQADEVIFVDADTKAFALSDIDIANQYFIQEDETTSINFSLGGQNVIDNSWFIDYEYAHSKTDNQSNGDRRVQFREQENIVYAQAFKDRIEASVITPEQAAALGGFNVLTDEGKDAFAGEADGDISDLSNMEFDNLFMEDSSRVDELTTIKANLKKELNWEHLNYIKTGFTYSEREHTRNKDRWSYKVEADDCNGNEACITVANSNITDYNYSIPENSGFSYPMVSENNVNQMVAATVITREAATAGEVSIDSTKEDYVLSEDTYAAYVMAELPVNDEVTIITGVRYAHTKFSSTGYLSLENDDWKFDGTNTLDISIPLPEASITYSEFFPSFHVRYEPTDDILVRGALWTSYTRPSFKQARGYAKFDSDISLCDPTNDNTDPDNPACTGSQDGQSALELQGYVLSPNNALQVGNPNLVAMTSNNIDTSIGWYPNKNLFMEAAIFYKDIDNFIVEANGIPMGIDELPLTLPVDHVSEFAIPQDLPLSEVDITLNGDKATVYGIELSYNQFFDNGLFWQSNVTFVHSEAELDPSVRQGKIQLPGQADITGNIAFGWENDDLSLRLITNYRSEILEEIGSCPVGTSLDDAHNCKTWSDVFQDDILTVDFKVKYDVTKNLSLYFDAINITDQADLRYIEGNDLSGGNILYQREEYGSTYQLGLNYKFY